MTDFLDDDFWDLHEVVNPDPEDETDLFRLESLTVGVSQTIPPLLAEYGQVLEQRFTTSKLMFVLADKNPVLAKPVMSKVCTVLGSISIEVGEDGKASWWHAIGSRPLPLDLNKTRRVPTACLMSRDCKSPQDFRNWLQLVSSKITATQGKLLADAVHPDNFIPDFRLALQLAHDLHMIGASSDLIFQPREFAAPPPPPGYVAVGPWPKTIMSNFYGAQLPDWKETTRLNSHVVKLFLKGQNIGTIFLVWHEGKWQYGGEINTIPYLGQQGTPGNNRLKFKHAASTTLTHDMVAEAKQAAWNLYFTKVFEWLLGVATTRPHLRGA